MNNIFRPYKSDVYQVEQLVKLGVSEPDICGIINITQPILNRWKSKNKVIEDALKPKVRPEYTLLHQDFAPMVEEAFTCAGKRFYRFKDEYRMPAGRYKYYYATLREVEMRVNIETLQKYVTTFENILNGSAKKPIQLGKLWELIINLKSRLALAFDPKTVKDLAAVAYFDDTEDLTTFEKKYGDEKVKLWEDNNLYSFFLTKPIGELFNLNSTSVESLEGHLKVMEEIIADLNSNLQTVSEESS